MTVKKFSSESVASGHPDKLADYISDSILDEILAQDRDARVAVETLTTNGLVQVAGEISTTAYVDIPAVVRQAVLDVGYDSSEKSFDGNTCGVNVAISEQSSEIASGVFHDEDSDEDPLDKQGAGDQGIMFGYATNENPALMPTPIYLAHKLARRLEEARKEQEAEEGYSLLYPDAKTQATISYEHGKPVGIDTILISTQHAKGTTLSQVTQFLTNEVISPVLEEYSAELLDSGLQSLGGPNRVVINPAGPWHEGGPKSDAGLTGRKIIVDTYGGKSRHGGGAFSGKDPSKSDRSSAYYARYVAKHIVAAGLADEVELQVAYAIGEPHPLGTYITTFGTEKVEESKIVEAVREVFDFRPLAIEQELQLREVPKYNKFSAYGHFGRSESDATWEIINLDKVAQLQRVASS